VADDHAPSGQDRLDGAGPFLSEPRRIALSVVGVLMAVLSKYR
jgi:hypothetical protein